MKKLILIFWIISPLFVFSQNIDSLKTALQNSKGDNHTQLLLQMSKAQFDINYDSSWFYGEKALQYARKSTNKSQLADILRFCGKVSYYRGQYDSCLLYTNNAVSIYKEIDDNVKYSLALNNLGIMYSIFGMMDSCYVCHQKALTINIALGDSIEISETYNNIGTYYLYSSQFDSAIFYYNIAIDYLNNDGKSTEASILNNIALAYQYMGDFEKSIDVYIQSLNIYEVLGDENNSSLIYNNIGSLYKEIGYYDKAIKYFQKKIELSEKNGNTIEYCKSISNIAGCYSEMKELDTAIKYYESALPLLDGFDDKDTKAFIYKGMADCLIEKKQNKEVLPYLEKALILREELNDQRGLNRIYASFGMVYSNLKEYSKAIYYFEKCIKYGDETQDIEVLTKALTGISQALAKTGKFKQAYIFLRRFNLMNDSIMNGNVQQQISDLETKYQTEKKEQQILLQNVELEKNQATIAFEKAEAEKKAAQRNLFMFGFGLILILAIVIFRGYRQKTESNKIIAEKNTTLNELITEVTTQKDEIEEQKTEIEEIHHEVSQSINYAKRIQTSILPESNILGQQLSDYFILFKPRDVVSGDFYWFTQLENKLFATVADCTGHGVPGAFMSMLGISFLREIVNKSLITQPNEILNNLRGQVVRTLKQKGVSGEQKDGMDLSFIQIDFDSLEVNFSGANNPLYIISKTEPNLLSQNTKMKLLKLNDTDEWGLYEIKPDKMPIAIYEKMNDFQNNRIQLQKNDRLYLFSDGYVDQFGGPKGKKFMSKPFKRLLLKLVHLGMQEQKSELEKELSIWMEKTQQVDDISVMGVEI